MYRTNAAKTLAFAMATIVVLGANIGCDETIMGMASNLGAMLINDELGYGGEMTGGYDDFGYTDGGYGSDWDSGDESDWIQLPTAEGSIASGDYYTDDPSWEGTPFDYDYYTPDYTSYEP